MEGVFPPIGVLCLLPFGLKELISRGGIIMSRDTPISDGSSTNRRNFMKNMIVLGGVSSILNASPQDLVSDDEVTVVERVKYERDENGRVVDTEPVYGTMERERWEKVEATRDVKEQIYTLLDDEIEGDITIMTSVSEESPTGLGLEVRTSDEKEIDDLLPISLEGGTTDTVENYEVPIQTGSSSDMSTNDVETSFCQEPSCSNYGSDLMDLVPGGAPLEVMRDDDRSYSTACSAFYHPDHGGHGWLISGHSAEEDGNTVRQKVGADFEEMGVTRDVTQEEYDSGADLHLIDFAFVEPTESTQIYRIADENYENLEETVSGYVTDSELDRNIGDLTLYKQGKESCRNSNTVTGTEERNGEIVAVRVDEAQIEGDSGGPLFHKDGDDAYIAGLLTGSDGDLCEAVYTTAETILEKTGGTF